MKYFWTLVAVFWCVNAHGFCVQTFNSYGPIYAPQVGDRTERLSQELMAQPCELIHLQEAWNGDQQRRLLKNLGSAYRYDAPNTRMKIGLMAFTKGQIKQSEVHAFRLNSASFMDSIKTLIGVAKGFQSMTLNLSDVGTDFLTTNLHTHPASGAVRLTQMLDLYQWRLNHQDLPWLVTGDFNFVANSFERDFFKLLLGVHDVQEELNGGYTDQCTFCGVQNPLADEKANYVLDYIFISNISQSMDWKWQAQNVAVNLQGKPGAPLSDHYGLRAQVTLVQDKKPKDWSAVKSRADLLLAALEKASAFLRMQRNSDFNSYIQVLERIHAQISSQNGEAWDYLALYE